MSTTKKLSNITNNQIASYGVQALSDRPNASGQYGSSGLSSTQLKLWFDKFSTFLAGKINEIQTTLSSDEAASYIRLLLDDYGVENLNDLVTAVTNGSFANTILMVLPSAAAGNDNLMTLQAVINKFAKSISDNAERITEKLDMDKNASSYARVYIVNKDGTQSLLAISESPLSGAVPVFVDEGSINVATPSKETHAINKAYVDGLVGDIDSALDIIIAEQESIIAIQNSLIGGDGE